MNRNTLRRMASRSLALLVVLTAAWRVQAQDAQTKYPTMASLDQYMMERNAEIELARSAAPESISHDAEVMVLGTARLRDCSSRKERFRVPSRAILVGRV